MDDQQLCLAIENLFRTSIENYFKKKKVDNYHILDFLFPTERYTYSRMGGLVTSMGTTFWEKLIALLCPLNGLTLKSKQDKKLLKPKPFPKILKDKVDTLKDLRRHQETWISIDECIKQIRQVSKQIDKNSFEFVDPTSGHGVDIYLIKDGKESVFDIKNTQPNRGDGLRFNDQLIDWYSYRLAKDPLTQIEARIVIPFNPFFPKTWWQSQGNKMFPLEEHIDIWVENEFWNFCSGKPDTWRLVLNALKNIQNDKDFIEKYKSYFYPKK